MDPRNALVSKLLAASYVFDWIVVGVAVAIGALVSNLTPNERPFSLVDADISYPYTENETVPLGLLVVVSLVVPAATIAVICLVLVPDAAVVNPSPRSRRQARLWEWHTGWLGLALALSTAFVFTSGMKNLFGRPRPDLISRCSPDLSQLGKYAVGSLDPSLARITQVVSSGICRNKALLKDGFRSFPSGHSSFSFAGLVYLTLFLSAKLRIALPTVPAPGFLALRCAQAPPLTSQHKYQHVRQSAEYRTEMDRLRAAAPPTYLWFVAVIPVAAAICIVSTRFFDYRHHAFDILFGSSIGIASAWLSFRWYNPPISGGEGWCWAPRRRGAAFGATVGSDGYGDCGGWSSAPPSDTEALADGGGLPGRELTRLARSTDDRST